jgi:hypothetical protein
MGIDNSKVNELISLVREKFSDWNGFSHPSFVDEEVTYKQATVKKANELLNKAALDRLIEELYID